MYQTNISQSSYYENDTHLFKDDFCCSCITAYIFHSIVPITNTYIKQYLYE